MHAERAVCDDILEKTRDENATTCLSEKNAPSDTDEKNGAWRMGELGVNMGPRKSLPVCPMRQVDQLPEGVRGSAAHTAACDGRRCIRGGVASAYWDGSALTP